MPAQDTSEIKSKIVSIIRQKGPCLPIAIAKDAGLNTLFTSAFLSELINEGKIKRSNMKIGSSSLYFTKEQEQMLASFSEFLKSKEKEAFNLLKNKKILKDSEQEPSIRVALRAIKDFAVSFKNDEDVYWKYFLVSDDEIVKIFENLSGPKVNEEKGMRITAVEPVAETDEIKKELREIIKEDTPKKIVKRKKSSAKKPSHGEMLLEKIKEFLSKSNVEILSVESIGKDEITLRVKEGQEEYLLISFGKKRVSEKEVIKASKKASELNLRYSIVSLGKLPKKTHDMINALRLVKKIDEVK